MATGYAVTKTWADPRPFDPAEFHPNLHETFEVGDLAQAGADIQWQNVGHGVWYGNNGRCGQSGLVTYIARPLDG